WPTATNLQSGYQISPDRSGARRGMTKKHRAYEPRIVGDKVMMPADLKRLHKYMLDVEHIGIISDEMREVVEELLARAGAQAAAEGAAGLTTGCTGREARARRGLEQEEGNRMSVLGRVLINRPAISAFGQTGH